MSYSDIGKGMNVELSHPDIKLKLNAHRFQQSYCKHSGPNRRAAFDEWGFTIYESEKRRKKTAWSGDKRAREYDNTRGRWWTYSVPDENVRKSRKMMKIRQNLPGEHRFNASYLCNHSTKSCSPKCDGGRLSRAKRWARERGDTRRIDEPSTRQHGWRGTSQPWFKCVHATQIGGCHLIVVDTHYLK